MGVLLPEVDVTSFCRTLEGDHLAAWVKRKEMNEMG